MTQKALAGRPHSGSDWARFSLSGVKSLTRLKEIGVAVAVLAPLLLAGAGDAGAQQAYYFPQAGNGPVTVNYGALTPYGGPAAPGYQPYGGQMPVAQPRSVFTPQAPVPGYGVPAYGNPAYLNPQSQILPGQMPAYQSVYGRPTYSQPVYTAAPIQAPFVAPYGNPAYPAGAPAGYATTGMPQSYLNVPGQAPVALYGTPQPGAKPFDPASMAPKKTRKKAAEPAPSAVEEAAAAQVAAVEAQLESGPAPATTPPEAPAEIPASVPSPADQAALVAPSAPTPASAPEAQAPEAPAPESAGADSAAVIEPPAEGTGMEGATAAIAEEAVPDAAAPDAAAAEEAAPEEATVEEATTGGAAPLPAGGARIVFEGDADDLPAGAAGELDAIAQRMLGDESIKV
ncbi:MAG: hypothetical protein JNL25_05695, partial [Rhodospirillaceae bacterium]|nr:hypothetical protein [Rhodospirillaceae bacterium]